MTNIQKNEIVQLIEAEYIRLGNSNLRVANKAGVSEARISQMRNGRWELITDDFWLKVGQALGMQQSGWQVAETLNYKRIRNICIDAKNNSLFMIVSDKAGIGKSATLKAVCKELSDSAVFYLCAREWAKRDFLLQLCTTLGIDPGKSYMKVDKLGMLVVDFFKKRAGQQPLLIIDEADKLKESALRWFIHLYNECEDEMSLIIAGTEALKEKIVRGVRLKRMGFDELESRFGRTYLTMLGATWYDVKKICEVNGVTQMGLQKDIFKELKPSKVEILIDGEMTMQEVIEDLRRLKRIIIRERLKGSN